MRAIFALRSRGGSAGSGEGVFLWRFALRLRAGLRQCGMLSSHDYPSLTPQLAQRASSTYLATVLPSLAGLVHESSRTASKTQLRTSVAFSPRLRGDVFVKTDSTKTGCTRRGGTAPRAPSRTCPADA